MLSVFFSIFFDDFLPWNYLPQFFCFPGALFSVFLWKNWGLFTVALRCCRFEYVGPFVRGFFFEVLWYAFYASFAQQMVCITASSFFYVGSSIFLGIPWPFQQLLWALRLRFQTSWQSLWPTCFIRPSQLSSVCFFIQRPSLPILLLPALSFFFQSCFPALFVSSALDSTSSLSSAATPPLFLLLPSGSLLPMSTKRDTVPSVLGPFGDCCFRHCYS